MVLEEQPIGARRVADDFVHALPELRILVREEGSTNPGVAGLPALSTVVCSVHASGGNRDQHPRWIRGIRKNRVKTETAPPGHPPWPMLVLEQAFDRAPAVAGVMRDEQRGR